MFRCREQCELLNEAVAKAGGAAPAALTAAAAKCLQVDDAVAHARARPNKHAHARTRAPTHPQVAEAMEKFQLANTARVTKIVQDFLPQDFRGSLVRR